MTDPGLAIAAQRQQLLLRALWRDEAPAALAPWLRQDGAAASHRLRAYQANAAAIAERALAAAYPTLQQLLGQPSFAALAVDLWFAHPPERGDLACWGAALPEFIEAAASLASEPYLADVARLEWAVHRAQTAADAPAQASGLEALADADAQTITLALRPGTVPVSSRFPIVSIWLAHRSHDAERFAPVREALKRAAAEHALVWRDGLVPRVAAVGGEDARFIAALLQGASLATALHDAGPDFVFETWFIAALRHGWITALAEPWAIAGNP